jgi:dTDP-4-amino-4,6-dideoxygalactose transaminase
LEKKIKIRLSKSFIGNEEKSNVLKVLQEGNFGMGNYVQTFEDKLKKILKKDVVCVVNGTAALHLAFQAIGLKAGDEVLVPTITYVSTFQAISATGAIPIACDVNYSNCLLDLKDASKRITSKTKAIVPVHYAGEVGDLESIYKFANKNKLRIIEDAAHAFGTIYKKKIIGSIGDIVCFSFDGIKNITSGEGGCVVTKDKSVIKKIKNARLLGVEKDTEKRFTNKRSWSFDVKSQGWRYHQSNLMAAIGIAQLQKRKILFKKRQELAKCYDTKLNNNNHIATFSINYNHVVPHIYPIKVTNKLVKKQIIKILKLNNIELGFHYFPNHLLSFYKNGNKDKLKISEQVYKELLTLPLHPGLTKKNVQNICQLINSCKV